MTAAGNEWLTPFEKALEAEERRARDPRFLRRNPQYFYNYLYFRSGLYGQQIDRYFKLFPRCRFLFLSFEDLKRDVRDVLRRVLRFIHVDPDFEPDDLSPANPSRRVRSARLQFYLRRRSSRRWSNYGWGECDRSSTEWPTGMSSTAGRHRFPLRRRCGSSAATATISRSWSD